MRPFSGPSSGIFELVEERPGLGRRWPLGALDWSLLAATLLLSLLGLATVHSASTELAVDYLPRQALWLGLACVALLVVTLVDYHLWIDLAVPLYALGLVALVLVLVLGEGPGGTRSWLVVGGMRLGQPVEMAKLTTLLMLARQLSLAHGRYLDPVQVLGAGLIVAAPMVLVVLQPDFGSAAMFAPLLAGPLLVAGVRLRLLGAVVLVLLATGAGVWTFAMQDYQRERVLTYVTPERDPLGAGYQVRQSKIAVGSGGLDGRGYMQGTQSQLRFLPARHTDFVFAVLAEEWGFLGVVTVLALYAWLLLTALAVAMRARDRAGLLLVVGLVSVLGFHVVYSTGMVVGLLPITGIPLPWLSYGGSFLLLSFAAVGLILNVHIRRWVNR